MRTPTTLFFLTAGLLAVGACSDDSTRPKAGYLAQVRVVDESGAPRPGVLMNLVSDNPYLQDAKRDKAATAVRFTLAAESRARMEILDIEGEPLRTLVDEALPAGAHRVIWDGRDDAGEHQRSGRYTVRLTVYSTGTGVVLFEDSEDMLMCLLDPQRTPVGVTDGNGRIRLTDRRLFPHLYDREPMNAHDETGLIVGELEPTNAMIFTLADTANGGGGKFRETVEEGSSFTFVIREPAAGSPEAAGVAANRGAAGPLRLEGPGPDPQYSLLPVYPNPFN